MLSYLSIKNYAVLDEVEIEFEPGLTVMTGETGAGKSILVDALGLALGDRADSSTVRTGAKRAEINVVFDCPAGHPALDWMAERGVDSDEPSCTLRRLVGAEGRSRAFVNGQPVGLQDLKDLGALLVDIHGQHAHQHLLRRSAQRRILDSHAGLLPLAAETATAFAAWRDADARLAAARASGDERAAELELLDFQIAELEALALEPGEVDRLYKEHARLANVDRLAQGLGAVLDQLYEGDAGSAHSLVAGARRALEGLAAVDSDLEAASRQLASAEIELGDVASTLLRYRDGLEPEPDRLAVVEERLGRVRTLARRHGVEETALPGLAEELQSRRDALRGGRESLQALEEARERSRASYLESASALSLRRSAGADALAGLVSSQLKELGLPHGEFDIEVATRAEDHGDATGLDDIEFRVQINPGQDAGPISRVASGGELSRISLALEVVAVGASTIPTYVFDEVDAGIGGGVAEIVGRRLREIASHRQVLCVTHLPQVASQGETHFRVVKLTDGQTSRTQVRELDEGERVEELSRMLGGIEITETTRAHAAEMIRNAR